MKLNISIEIWQKKRYFVAKCPELDFITQGKTKNEARRNLLEVIDIQFEEMAEDNTLEGYLAECGYEKENGTYAFSKTKIDTESLFYEVA